MFGVLAITAPPWLEHEWTHQAAYNFASSEWGGVVFHAVEVGIAVGVARVLLRPLRAKIHHHLECDHPGCNRWGRPVAGTSHRACEEHHPHSPWETHADDMAHHARHGHDRRLNRYDVSPDAGGHDGERAGGRD